MVITNVNSVTYNGDGTNKAWPYTFRIIKDSDINVMLTSSDGTETQISSDFFVDTVNNTVYYPGYAPGSEPPEADQPPEVQVGEKITIYRSLPVTQEADLGSKWPFNVIELGLDKLTMLIQDLMAMMGRCLKVRMSDAESGFDATIPAVPGKAIQIKKDGTGFECVDAPSEVLSECYTVLAQTVEAKGEAVRYEGEAAASAANALQSETSALTAAGDAADAANTAKDSADSVVSQAALVEEDLAKVEGYIAAAKEVGLWDPAETYNPGDAVMVANGDVYRCLQTSTNEDPETTPASWALTQTVQLRTFEVDTDGDLMPMASPTTSANWDIDADGDIMPAA